MKSSSRADLELEVPFYELEQLLNLDRRMNSDSGEGSRAEGKRILLRQQP
jgi:hypothetical protein